MRRSVPDLVGRHGVSPSTAQSAPLVSASWTNVGAHARNGHYCFLGEGLGGTPASCPRLAHFIACTRAWCTEICTWWSSEGAQSFFLDRGIRPAKPPLIATLAPTLHTQREARGCR